MSSTPNPAQPLGDPSKHQGETQGLPLTAALLLGFLCFLWGANSVTIKISSQGLPPLMTATLRSMIAGALVWAYARRKGHRVSFPPGQTRHAPILGLLFGLEFLFLYWGLSFTPASRSLIFLYTHPFWVALGAHLLLKSDRLTPVKLSGLVLAFCGVAAVLRARSPELPPHYLIGDLMELVAAIFWAANTLYVKHITASMELDHYQTLFAQLTYAIPILVLGSFLFELPAEIHLTWAVSAALLYQSVVVAFASYLVWFWMICRYTVSGLSAFTFMAPLFGVILGGLVLNEAVPPLVWVGLACVAGGVYVVNR